MERFGSSFTDVGIPKRLEAGIDRISATVEDANARISEAAASATSQIGRKGRDLLVLRDRWMGAAGRCARKYPATTAGVVLTAFALVVGAGLLFTRRQRPDSTSQEK